MSHLLAQLNADSRAFLAFAVLFPALARSNDAAAEIAAGGVQLRAERRVIMVKEQLYIGPTDVQKETPGGRKHGDVRETVRVDYEFMNDSSEDVSTEVAFPTPLVNYRGVGASPTSDFGDFRVWVDSRLVVPKKDVKAMLGTRDVTPLLTALEVSIEDFGRFDYEDDGAAFKARLGPERLASLVREKLVATGDLPWPRWQVSVTYHWNQVFPAGKVVRVSHEYTPAFGYELVQVATMAEAHKDGCFDSQVVRNLLRRLERGKNANTYAGDYVRLRWVKYILTTANTWRTPIKDFELVVERPKDQHISFCWGGKVERLGETKFRASAKNFVPTTDLVVYFY